MTRLDYLDRLNRRMASVSVNSRHAHTLDVRKKLRDQWVELDVLRVRVERMSELEFVAWREERE